VLDHDTVSRRHAQLRRTGGGWEILDLGSLNGTWVNGWRVDRATLHDGDVVQLGDLRVDITR
jgi:pSer/pThr/pTyr-binding forkhead associated (FHA) protein